MPKFNQNIRKTDLSAMLSGSVILTAWHGRIVVSQKAPPPRRTKNSPGQQESIMRKGPLKPHMMVEMVAGTSSK